MSDSKLKLRRGRKSATYLSHAIYSKHTHTNKHTRTYVCVCVYVCMYIYRMYVCIYIYTHTHTRTHTHTHTHTHIYIYIYTHTHTHTHTSMAMWGNHKQRVKIVINDNIIEQVTDLKYLGYCISEFKIPGVLYIRI